MRSWIRLNFRWSKSDTIFLVVSFFFLYLTCYSFDQKLVITCIRLFTWLSFFALLSKIIISLCSERIKIWIVKRRWWVKFFIAHNMLRFKLAKHAFLQKSTWSLRMTFQFTLFYVVSLSILIDYIITVISILVIIFHGVLANVKLLHIDHNVLTLLKHIYCF